MHSGTPSSFSSLPAHAASFMPGVRVDVATKVPMTYH